MKRIHYFLVAILIILCTNLQNSYSQVFNDGYIVNHDQDTIVGYVNPELPKDRITKEAEFIALDGKEKIVYSYEDIKAYGEFNGFAYISISDTAKTHFPGFYRLIYQGRISLLKLNDKIFLQKENGRLTHIEEIRKSNKHIGILTTLLDDCESLRLDNYHVKVHEKSLLKILNDYDNCFGSNSKTFKNNTDFKVNWGIMGMLNHNSLSIKHLDDGVEDILHGKHKINHTISPLVFIELADKNISRNFLWRIELEFTRDQIFSGNLISSKFNETTEAPKFNSIIEEFHYSLTTIKTAIGMNYYKPINLDYSLFMGASLINNLHLTSDASRYRFSHRELKMVADTTINLTKFAPGGNLSFGLQKKMGNLYGLFGYRIEYSASPWFEKEGFHEIINSKLIRNQVFFGIKF
ncbi:hypothetical protein MATR_18390 [Marivirga tractuosa]|uniref:Uncharacterized protein n=1 Tax=Marivirga tractuosa (strain ATCC 23168 / DSM 4126 / NBRC 15989 / NCIMB 1408 / VKM B-1430 / H-43) TaxID=643867 RepID=E4TPY1_MARTH|nr:hypothetical protein [Marivirga tractuosa]ADR20538.1 hypothetical protein Ftrac_0534 [Marivirga tractuosa DSM 4126]BDD15014.1 hypothetical protein MATR_18390 [Marivirga tractuosa]